MRWRLLRLHVTEYQMMLLEEYARHPGWQLVCWSVQLPFRGLPWKYSVLELKRAALNCELSGLGCRGQLSAQATMSVLAPGP